MEVSLQPQRHSDYSPQGCPRSAYPELTDEEYIQAVCAKAVEERSPAAGF
jgi:hypothetical protein